MFSCLEYSICFWEKKKWRSEFTFQTGAKLCISPASIMASQLHFEKLFQCCFCFNFSFIFTQIASTGKKGRNHHLRAGIIILFSFSLTTPKPTSCRIPQEPLSQLRGEGNRFASHLPIENQFGFRKIGETPQLSDSLTPPFPQSLLSACLRRSQPWPVFGDELLISLGGFEKVIPVPWVVLT